MSAYIKYVLLEKWDKGPNVNNIQVISKVTERAHAGRKIEEFPTFEV